MRFIIMIENAHKHLERDQGQKPHWEIIRDAAIEVGPTLFYSLLGHYRIVPAGVHVAGAGRPVVQTAGIHQDVFDGGGGGVVHHARADFDGLVHSRQNSEGGKEPINRFLIWLYHPVIDFVIKWRWKVVIAAR